MAFTRYFPGIYPIWAMGGRFGWCSLHFRLSATQSWRTPTPKEWRRWAGRRVLEPAVAAVRNPPLAPTNPQPADAGD